MAKSSQARAASAAAYTLVDMSDLDEDVRKEIVEDAAAGGGNYGIRVVEESINGGARAPIYGYYKDGPDADRWEEAKKQFGLSAAEGDDAEARAAASGEVTDPRREAALRQAAEERARADADALRSREDAEVERISGQTHSSNIVDDTLAKDAENEVSDADPADAEETTRPTRRNTRTPK